MKVRLLIAVVGAATVCAAAPAHASLPLHKCTVQGLAARCGTLSVPENRAIPTSRMISLRIAVLPATVKRTRNDPFVYLAGGPGGAATQSAAAVAGIWYELRENRDILLVDQRGTGGSNALACAPPTGEISTPAEATAYVQSCTAALTGDASQYGATAGMDDLEAVRKALGYGKLDLYGISYGATAAQVFLRRHPGSVRTVVLDGATLLDVPFMSRFASNGQRALDLIASRCAAQPGCARAFPTWRADLLPLLARLQAAPVTVQVAGTATVVDDLTVEGEIQDMTRSDDSAAWVPLLVSRAAAGDYSVLTAHLSPPAPPNLSVMYWSSKCNEPWWGEDPVAMAADAKGTYLEHSIAVGLESDQIVCAGFPKRAEPPEQWTRVQSSAPALALVGGADPQDPIGNIAGLQALMPGARIVVAPGMGHGVGAYGCLPHLVARLVALGSAKKLDTSCARKIAPRPFLLR
ncbi:MAG: alpha/beta fold hydrolase [Gaiellaceae bacterium]